MPLSLAFPIRSTAPAMTDLVPPTALHRWIPVALVSALSLSCGPDSENAYPGDTGGAAPASGGSRGTAGASGGLSGGAVPAGGSPGSPSAGGGPSGGVGVGGIGATSGAGSGGVAATGGLSAVGGSMESGVSGGMPSTGGAENLGGSMSTGGAGAQSGTGGVVGSGGTESTGGAATGDDTGVGGTGGAATGGDTGVGGTGGAATGGDTGVGGTGGASVGTGGTGAQEPPEGQCVVQQLTEEFRRNYDNLDPFYQKYADANGVPIVSSLSPADEALERACALVVDMVSERPDVLAAMIENRIRFAIIGENELTNDIPEYSYMPDSINDRARGLGGVPAASCAEESILCHTALDRWSGEGICVHEFAHTIASGGLFPADPTFEERLLDAYASAQAAGRFANTYAMENYQEYWAEAVQDWYYTNLEADPPNGIHNFVDTRAELLEYDPVLHALADELLPNPPGFVDCYSDENG